MVTHHVASPMDRMGGNCKLSACCQQDVCTMPNNFTAVGLRDATLKDPNLDEMPAHCTYIARDIVGCMVLSTRMDFRPMSN